MEAGDNLEVTVDLTRMNKKKDKDYWLSKREDIVKGVCALLNSFGGKLQIKIESEDVVDFEDILDNILRATEQRLKQFMTLWWFNQLVKMPNLQDKQYIYEIRPSNKVFTIKYHLHLPTFKQVEEIPPFEAHENIKHILTNTETKSHPIRVNEFVFNESISLTESDAIQFKYLKAERSSKTTIADRITNSSNKLAATISAFGNKYGGNLLYGIENNGVVKGQRLTEGDRKEILEKVRKLVSKMIWFQRKMKQGEDWNIEFMPVKDNHDNKVPSLFVIKISVKALPGGVFVVQPESYHIGFNNGVELMPFDVWRSRIVFGVKKVNIPASLSRIQWSSAGSQRKYFHVIFELNQLQNQANYNQFKILAKAIKAKHSGTATELFVMAIESVVAYKRGMMTKAEEIVHKIEASLKSGKNIDDHKIIEFRILYAKSAIARAKGDYELSYKLAKEGQQLAVLIPPGVLTAWFYNHVAIVEKFLSQQEAEETGKNRMENSALNHYRKALDYAKNSNIEQEFTQMIADLEQRIHIFRAITTLGNFLTGADLSAITPSNIKAAESDILRFKGLVVEGFLPSNYRRTYSVLAECDLRFAQWYLQHLNERRRQEQQHDQQQEEQQNHQRQHQPQQHEHENQQKVQLQQKQLESYTSRSSMVNKIPDLLKEAHNFALEGRKLSKQFCFEELTLHANNRRRNITEMMVKLSIGSTLKRLSSIRD